MHKASAALIVSGDFADCTIVFGEPGFDVAGVLKQIAYAAPGPAGQRIQMGRDLSSQAFRALW
jgi:hypothetical protein